MKVSIKAQIFLESTRQTENKKYCLFSVLSGGCSGMQYSMLFVDELPKYEVVEIVPNFYVDSLSLNNLQDSIVDVEEKPGMKKIIVKNPQAVSTCSCGSSFST